MLAEQFDVRTLIGNGFGQVFNIIRNISGADVIVCWFGSVYAFIAVLCGRMMGKNSIIILGGVDAAKDATMGYGIWLSPWKSVLVRYALRHASRVFVGDTSMKENARTLAKYDGNNIEYLPPGFDSEYWKPAGEKERIVLTVASVDSDQRLTVKGIPTLIEAALILTNVRFILVGVSDSIKRKLVIPENMTILGLMKRDELLQQYRRAKIYCQPSFHEAVGYSLREAMLCGCIPVVSDVGGMKRAAGGIGLLVPPGNVDALVVAIQQAMRMETAAAAQARAHIVALYPIGLRKSQLHQAVKELAE